jgi:soluble lytic murein transglycosylase-like protein
MKTIKKISEKHGVDPNLIGAIIMCESAGNPWACRFEPHVYRRGTYINLKAKRPATCSADTEKVFQSTSFGLMQIMGFNLRDMGFEGWLPEVCTPEINIEYGCRFVARLLKRWPRIEDTVSAYNQGSPRKSANRAEYQNQPYVSKVMRWYKELGQ